MSGHRRFWQAHTDRDLSSDDSRECNVNIVGFFKVLLEWAAIDSKQNEDIEGPLHRDTLDIGSGETNDE